MSKCRICIDNSSLLILIQGLISALNRINIGLSLGMSILSTMLFIIGLQADDTQDLMYSYGKIYFMCKRVIITRIEKRRPHLYTGITDEVSFLLDSFTMFLNIFCPG